MPIKNTSMPWFFVPSFSSNAKVVIVMQMQLMILYFAKERNNIDKYVPRNNSYIPKYIERIKSELKITAEEFNKATNNLSAENGNILLMLRDELSSDKQRKYCRELFNTLALHISNDNPSSTNSLNEYIDNTIDVVLR